MRRVFPALLLVLASASPAATQTRPDLTGTWTMDETRSESPTHDGFTSPVIWVIRQTSRSLEVDITRGAKTFTLTYKLYEKAPTSPAAEGVPSYRAYWDGDKLVTEMTQNIQGQTVTTKEVRILHEGGKELTVERLVQVEHGYTLRGAQNYNTAKDVFRRTK